MSSQPPETESPEATTPETPEAPPPLPSPPAVAGAPDDPLSRRRITLPGTLGAAFPHPVPAVVQPLPKPQLTQALQTLALDRICALQGAARRGGSAPSLEAFVVAWAAESTHLTALGVDPAPFSSSWVARCGLSASNTSVSGSSPGPAVSASTRCPSRSSPGSKGRVGWSESVLG